MCLDIHVIVVDKIYIYIFVHFLFSYIDDFFVYGVQILTLHIFFGIIFYDAFLGGNVWHIGLLLT